MPSLVFRDVPPRVEYDKDTSAATVSVTGSAVAQTELLRALLMHGTYDKYYCLCSSQDLPQARQRLSQYPNAGRACVISADEIGDWSGAGELVLLTGRSSPLDLVHFRKMMGRCDWPVAGITHALSYLDAIPHALALLLEDLYEYDALICTSRAGLAAMRGIFEQLAGHVEQRLGTRPAFRAKLPLIPLGVDEACAGDREAARKQLGIPADRTLLLYFGRLSPVFKMDPFPLLQRFSHAVAKGRDNVLLILAGNDTHENTGAAILSFARELGIGDRVRVLPNIRTSDKAALYAAADVFVSLSDNVQETFGITILEAMARGLPVIASDWSGYRDTVEHGVTGFLVPAYWGPGAGLVSRCSALDGNAATHRLLAQHVALDLRALSEYLAALCDNPELRAAMGRAGRERALRHFSWRHIVQRYEDLWRQMLDEAGHSHHAAGKGFRHGLASFDYLAVFGHYATGAISQESLLRLTPLGQRLLDGEPGIVLWPDGQAGWADGLHEKIAAACSANRETRLRDVVTSLCTAFRLPGDVIPGNIARLVKHGVLEWRNPS